MKEKEEDEENIYLSVCLFDCVFSVGKYYHFFSNFLCDH